MTKEYIIREEAMSLPVLPKEHRIQLNNVDEAFEEGWKQALENLANLPARNVVSLIELRELMVAKFKTRLGAGYIPSWNDAMKVIDWISNEFDDMKEEV